MLKSSEVYVLDVCPEYDPSGGFRDPLFAVGKDVLYARFGPGVSRKDPSGGFRYSVEHDVVAEGYVSFHAGTNFSVGVLKVPDRGSENTGEFVNIRTDEFCGVDEAALRKERVVGSVHKIVVQIVHGVHYVNGCRELFENRVQFRPGIVAGDTVVSVGGRSVKTWTDMQTEVQISGGRPTEFVVSREGEPSKGLWQ